MRRRKTYFKDSLGVKDSVCPPNKRNLTPNTKIHLLTKRQRILLLSKGFKRKRTEEKRISLSQVSSLSWTTRPALPWITPVFPLSRQTTRPLGRQHFHSIQPTLCSIRSPHPPAFLALRSSPAPSSWSSSTDPGSNQSG